MTDAALHPVENSGRTVSLYAAILRIGASKTTLILQPVMAALLALAWGLGMLSALAALALGVLILLSGMGTVIAYQVSLHQAALARQQNAVEQMLTELTRTSLQEPPAPLQPE